MDREEALYNMMVFGLRRTTWLSPKSAVLSGAVMDLLNQARQRPYQLYTHSSMPERRVVLHQPMYSANYEPCLEDDCELRTQGSERST